MFLKFINQNGNKRQVKIEAKTFAEVRKAAEKLWGEEAKQCLIAYQDSDEELITIINDEDWQLCLEETSLTQEGRKIQKIVLHLVPADEEDFDIVNQSLILEQDPPQAAAWEEPVEKKEEEVHKPVSFMKDILGIDIEHMVAQAQKAEEAKKAKEAEEAKMAQKDTEFVHNFFSAPVQNALGRRRVSEPDVKKAPIVVRRFFMAPIETAFKKMEAAQKKEEEKPVEAPEEPEQPEEPEVISFEKEETEDSLAQKVGMISSILGFNVNPETMEIKNEPKIESTQDKDSSLASSTFTTEMKSEIDTMIEKKVQEQLNKSLVNINPHVETGPRTVHAGFTCDGCGVCPIVGVRFHSLVKRNFDLCEVCERTIDVDDAMLRIRGDNYEGFSHSCEWMETSLNLLKFDKRRPKKVVKAKDQPIRFNYDDQPIRSNDEVLAVSFNQKMKVMNSKRARSEANLKMQKEAAELKETTERKARHMAEIVKREQEEQMRRIKERSERMVLERRKKVEERRAQLKAMKEKKMASVSGKVMNAMKKNMKKIKEEKKKMLKLKKEERKRQRSKSSCQGPTFLNGFKSMVTGLINQRDTEMKRIARHQHPDLLEFAQIITEAPIHELNQFMMKNKNRDKQALFNMAMDKFMVR